MVYTLCLILFMIGLYGVLTQKNLIKSFYEADKVDVQATADIIEDHLRQFLHEHKMLLHSLTMDHHILQMLQGEKDISEPEHIRYFDSIHKAHEHEISSFTLLDDKGVVLHRSPFWSDGSKSGQYR